MRKKRLEESGWRRMKTYDNLRMFIDDYSVNGRLTTTGVRKLIGLYEKGMIKTIEDKNLFMDVLINRYPDLVEKLVIKGLKIMYKEKW